jgi:chemotaxis protein MotA
MRSSGFKNYSLPYSKDTKERGVKKKALFLFLAVLIGGLIFFRERSLQYFDPVGLLIVLGGSFSIIFVQYTFSDIQQSLLDVGWAFRAEQENINERVHFFISLAKKQKEDGYLVLEKAALYVEDPFLKNALQIAVDNKTSLKEILENEMYLTASKRNKSANVLHTMGIYAPALGLIGTLIGLIEMLKTIHTPSGLGASMSIALVSTLYGAFFSNLILLPLAGKIKIRNEEEMHIKKITIIGMLCLAHEENSYLVEQKMESFLQSASNMY